MKIRLRLFYIQTMKKAALVEEARRPVGMRPMTWAKPMHNMRLANLVHMASICQYAGWMTKELGKAIESVASNCYRCVM